MKIALVHYHLKTGGVTTVLKQQVAALQPACECLVLTGDRANAELPCKILEIQRLGYDQPGARPINAERVAGQVMDALNQHWPGGCDIIHVHNPLIAKNSHFLGIIKLLQQAGATLFLQLHDFAEDGRPTVYYLEEYPVDCHYGVINMRDKKIMQKAGLEDTGLHYLPNAINPLPTETSIGHKPLVLYPVRAIRRKNIGEAILLSMFLPKGKRLAITQPPNSPADAVSYRDWVRWISDNRLPVDVEAGRKMPFARLVGEAESVVTTSISEGFGFSFLEPWTARKWLWGRRLGDVCEDFENTGIHLDGLYDYLGIPLEWIDTDLLSQCWKMAVADAARSYDYPIVNETINRVFANLIHSGQIDFGMLNETLQRQVVARLIKDPASRKTLLSMNPHLDGAGTITGQSRTIDHNRQAVLAHYGLEQYRARLTMIYDQVARTRVSQKIDKKVVIDAFLDLDRFSLLKWGRYAH